MLHKIILGGEQYLPFARSCIAKLKKLGLPYASQTFQVDGVSINVRIEPGHEYIRIDGDSPSIYMDSGVVDVRAVVPTANPDNYAPVLLHKTEHNSKYDVGFTNRKYGWWTNPTKTGSGQFSGELATGANPKGRVPDDAKYARSFLPKIIAGPEEGDLALNQTDDDVWEKKLMATDCPASMFTGRCRLYVQALYGAYTPKGFMRGDGKLKRKGSHIKLSTSPSGLLGQPSLRIGSYVSTEEKALGVGAVEILLTTGSGVYYDEQTGKHWLLNPANGTVAIYPLIADSIGERARATLKANPPDMSADDKEHLEAYVLSTCKPWATQAVVCTTGTEAPDYSMGYGWHWNWSGTCADIAENIEERIGDEGGFHRYGVRSTHYRINVSPTSSTDPLTEEVTTTWAASSQVISGPSLWSAKRIAWNIVEPNWVMGGGESVIPYYGSYQAGEGTFYVFYKKDELQLCKVLITKVEAEQYRTRSDPHFAPAAFGGTVSGSTLGMGSGWVHDLSISEHFVAKFSCGEESKTVKVLYQKHDVNVSTGPKSKTESIPTPTPYTGVGVGALTYEYGYPDESGNYESITYYPTVVGGALTDGVYDQKWSDPYVTYDMAFGTDIYTSESSVTIVIPVMDAESVFFHATTNDEVTKITDTELRASYALITVQGIRKKPGGELGVWDGTFIISDPVTKYNWAPGSYVGPVVRTTPSTTTVDDTKKLVCKAGSIDADMPNLALFHGEDDTPIFAALSGSRTNSPTVISPDRVTPVGTSTDSNKAVLVGWI